MESKNTIDEKLKFDFSEILETQPSLGISGTELGHLMIRLVGTHAVKLHAKGLDPSIVATAGQIYAQGVIAIVDELTNFGLLPKYILDGSIPD